jgi:hypothetical protein
MKQTGLLGEGCNDHARRTEVVFKKMYQRRGTAQVISVGLGYPSQEIRRSRGRHGVFLKGHQNLFSFSEALTAPCRCHVLKRPVGRLRPKSAARTVVFP